MKVYLKSGQSIRVDQETIKEIEMMKKEQVNDPNNSDNILIRRRIRIKSIYLWIDIDEVIAMK